MTRQFRPLRVYQTAKAAASSSIFPGQKNVPPAWLPAIESIPPTEVLTRPYAIQHREPNRRAKKPSKLYKPTRIVYPEDKLRRTFYRDHPWELARPRMILEMDGLDSRYCDWSKGVRQPGMALSGECVVQRQLWLMEHGGKTKEQAYDQARKEFYQLRQEEEVERRIAQEEARMVGAYFGKTAMQVGMELEDKEFERWKNWAQEQNIKIDAERSQAYTSFGNDAEEAEAAPGVVEEAEAQAA
ncbi:hypothetical protein VTK73DRAFT_8507 [Phialemonium thermophilum]|uniref:37S ribosomal protein S25, mitochondrial n=1 Tax=Phialemonium thermophilum TaxID=223376 RepID=A0ABR3XNN4_9PEZI